MDSVDHTDRAIIALLNEDGRMSSAEIARRLGDVPSRTVSHRIDHLIEREIISVKAIVNPPALGYNVLADVFIEKYLPASNHLSEEAITGFFVMNISGMSVVVFLLVYCIRCFVFCQGQAGIFCIFLKSFFACRFALLLCLTQVLYRYYRHFATPDTTYSVKNSKVFQS